jgi:hypothetical protein
MKIDLQPARNAQMSGSDYVRTGRVARYVFSLIVLAPVFTGLLLAEDRDTKVFSPDASLFGKELDDWSAEWQKWFISIPVSHNPSFDNGPCSAAQSGPVWFISGSGNFTPVTRQCTVPAGKVILLTLINAECSSVEAPPFFGANEKAREECAEAIIDGVSTQTLKLTIDGLPVRNLSRYRVQSPEYKFTMPASDNVLGVTGATSGRSVSDGYFLLVQLAPGAHLVHFEAAFVSGPGAGLKQDVTYLFFQI